MYYNINQLDIFNNITYKEIVINRISTLIQECEPINNSDLDDINYSSDLLGDDFVLYKEHCIIFNNFDEIYCRYIDLSIKDLAEILDICIIYKQQCLGE